MARASRRGAGSLPGVAVGDHAAADQCDGGAALFRGLSRSLSDPREVGERAGRGRHAGLGRPRLLLAGAQSPRLRTGFGGPARRPLSGDGGGAPQAARHRRLHGGGDRRHRLQPAGRRRRRQCRAGRLASLSRRGAAAGRQGGHQGAHRIARPDGPAGRFRASLDGSRRHDLHAEAAGLRAVPVEAARAAPAPPACKRAFRASRRRRKGRCGAGPPSWRFAPTRRFSCAPGPPRVSSAAWPSRRRAPGRRITIRTARSPTRPSPRSGGGSPESSGTPSRISRSS